MGKISQLLRIELVQDSDDYRQHLSISFCFSGERCGPWPSCFDKLLKLHIEGKEGILKGKNTT